MRFAVHDGTRVIYEPAPGMDDDSVRLFLFGSGIAAALMQRGFLVLHGNAIETETGCVICTGDSGAGKSTVAAGMMRRGYRIVADDVCALDSQKRAIPGMPRIKVWQETASLLGIDKSGLARIRPGFEKFNLPLGEMFCATPLTIAGLIVLEKDRVDVVNTAPVTGSERAFGQGRDPASVSKGHPTCVW